MECQAMRYNHAVHVNCRSVLHRDSEAQYNEPD